MYKQIRPSSFHQTVVTVRSVEKGSVESAGPGQGNTATDIPSARCGQELPFARVSHWRAAQIMFCSPRTASERIRLRSRLSEGCSRSQAGRVDPAQVRSLAIAGPRGLATCISAAEFYHPATPSGPRTGVTDRSFWIHVGCRGFEHHGARARGACHLPGPHDGALPADIRNSGSCVRESPPAPLSATDAVPAFADPCRATRTGPS